MNRVLEGMNIIAKYEPDADVSAEHDQIWFGSYATFEQMSADERKRMDELNWFEDEGSWTHFV